MQRFIIPTSLQSDNIISPVTCAHKILWLILYNSNLVLNENHSDFKGDFLHWKCQEVTMNTLLNVYCAKIGSRYPSYVATTPLKANTKKAHYKLPQRQNVCSHLQIFTCYLIFHHFDSVRMATPASRSASQQLSITDMANRGLCVNSPQIWLPISV